MAELVQTRIVTLADVPSLVDFMFLDAPIIDEAAWTKTFGSSEAVAMLEAARASFETVDWTSDLLKSTTEECGATLGLKLGKAQAPVRVAVTGRTVGPPLFEALELLGRDSVLARIDAARRRLG